MQCDLGPLNLRASIITLMVAFSLGCRIRLLVVAATGPQEILMLAISIGTA
jgi:hypothetical protein